MSKRSIDFILILLIPSLIHSVLVPEKIWKHKTEILTHIWRSTLDSWGNVLITPTDMGVMWINEFFCEKFIGAGQGPNEVIGEVRGLCQYQDGLAVFETPTKIKIFKRSLGPYSFKETIWIKPELRSFILSEAVFHRDTLFLLGENNLTVPESNVDVSLVQVYDMKAKRIVKNLVHRRWPWPTYLYQLKFFLPKYKECALFIVENELSVQRIDLAKLEETGAVRLQVPGFYKPMPASNYTYVKRPFDRGRYVRDLEEWATNYSAITQAVVTDSGTLVIQIRTADPMKQKFALLFYDINDRFALKRTEMTNDLLLGCRGELLYCFKNGDPAYDDAGGNFVTVNIYRNPLALAKR